MIDRPETDGVAADDGADGPHRLAAITLTLAALAIVVAPWLGSPTRPRVAVLLCALPAALLLAQAAARRPFPPIGRTSVAFVAATLAWGAFLVVNARAHYDDRTVVLVPRRQTLPWAPGAVDRYAGLLFLLQLATALLTGVAILHVARSRSARTALLWAMAVSGGLVGFLGALDRFGVGPIRFAQDSAGGTHFAAFGYHANAAAYVNLVLPAALVLTVRSWRPAYGVAAGRTTRWASMTCTAGTLAGCALNVSKAGQALTFVTLTVAATSHLTRAPTRQVARDRRHVLPTIGVAVAIFAVALVGAAGAASRWEAVPGLMRSDNGRLLMWRVGMHAVGRSPFTGSGPGSFKLLIPDIVDHEVPQLYRHWIVQFYRRDRPVSIWMQMHNDPLQALVEWGPVGLALLMAIFLAPIFRGAGALRRRMSVDWQVVAAGTIALVVLGIHSLVDFPLQMLSIQLTAAAWGAIVLGAAADSPAPATR